MAGASGALGPKTETFYVDDTVAALPAHLGSGWASASDADKWAAVEAIATAAHKLGRVMEAGDVAETAETISQGYYGDDDADSVAGLTSREAWTVQLRSDMTSSIFKAVRDMAIGTTRVVAIVYKTSATAQTALVFVAQLAGRTISQPSGGLANMTLSWAPQGDLRWVDEDT